MKKITIKDVAGAAGDTLQKIRDQWGLAYPFESEKASEVELRSF
ncbi:MAG: hypothetical protein ACOYBE_04005 [Blautia sp.]